MVGRRPSASPRFGSPPATSRPWTDPTATVTERVKGGFWSKRIDLMASPGGIGMGRRGLERSNGRDALISARNLQHTATRRGTVLSTESEPGNLRGYDPARKVIGDE